MVKVIQVGLGPLGQQLARYALARGYINIVGAVDPAPDKAGGDLGELCGLKALGVTISPDLATAIDRKSAQVAILTTVSGLREIERQVVELANAGLCIVSTCEELSFPWTKEPEISARIDQACKNNGVACLATGVNPGFLMDYLPTIYTGICQRVDRIKVSRVQNASARRVPFQKKIGAGLTLADFQKKIEDGSLRHVGLTESLHMIAHRMGWNLDSVTESIDPVIAEAEITGGHAPIQPGQACGVRQVGRGFVRGVEALTLEFRAAVGEPESYERIEISGEPSIVSTIPGGVNGDIATCAIVINAVRSVLQADKGLRTMLDVPVVAYAADF